MVLPANPKKINNIFSELEARALNELKKRKVDKIYWAISHSTPPELEGRLIHWLVKDHKKNVVSAFKKAKRNAVKAELEYRVIGKISDENLIEIKLLTGRFHQIRIQLKSIGCSIVGDIKYGFPKPNRDGSICLHARKLTIAHPVLKEIMTFEAPLPENNWNNFISFN